MIEMKLALAQMVFEYGIDMTMAADEKHLSAIERLHRREKGATDRFVVASQGPYVRFKSRF